MRSQAITQIILVALSLVMIFTIVRPTFESVRTNQDEIAKFREAVNTAGMFNAKLGELRARAESFNRADLEALETYLPAEIDPLAVSRDIVAIVEKNGMALDSIEAGESSADTDEGMVAMGGDPDAAAGTAMAGPADPAMGGDPMMVDPMMAGVAPGVGMGSLITEAENLLVTQSFTVEVLGTYEQLKTFLADMEQNAYPLRLVNLEFGDGGGEGEESVQSDGYSFSLEVETYALASKQL